MTPNLIHKVKIIVEPVNKQETSQDEDAREAIGNTAYLPAITIVAQIEYRRGMQSRTGSDLQVVVFTGSNFEEFGYALIRVRDAAAKNWTPSDGDRIAKIGHRIVDLYLFAFQPIGHYADQNGNSMLRCYFQDRAPASTAKGPR